MYVQRIPPNTLKVLDLRNLARGPSHNSARMSQRWESDKQIQRILWDFKTLATEHPEKYKKQCQKMSKNVKMASDYVCSGNSTEYVEGPCSTKSFKGLRIDSKTHRFTDSPKYGSPLRIDSKIHWTMGVLSESNRKLTDSPIHRNMEVLSESIRKFTELWGPIRIE